MNGDLGGGIETRADDTTLSEEVYEGCELGLEGCWLEMGRIFNLDRRWKRGNAEGWKEGFSSTSQQ